MAVREGNAEWRGDLKSGEGDLRVGEMAWEAPYSFASRFEDAGGTNPEELIATAHAACFSMFLSALLADDGHEPEFVNTTAKVHFDTAEGQITRIELETEGRVDGIDEQTFRDQAQRAKQDCPISKALAAVDEVTVDAQLADA